MSTYDIAVVHGDGIGPEVCSSAVEVLRAIPALADALRFTEFPGGANEYLRSGAALPKATLDGCRAAHAILHGAAGIPGVAYADGTEAGIEFGLQLRFSLDLYANVRPIRLRPGVRPASAGRAAGCIDYVIVRENTEGLYAARGGGVDLLHDEMATDTLVITRKGTERICARRSSSRAAATARRATASAASPAATRPTCCAAMRSSARSSTTSPRTIPTSRPTTPTPTRSCYMIKRPEHFDVIVTENMFGDIISDLGASSVGSMGMSPSAELGLNNGFFQAAHGSAPTIAGQNIANPYGTILSAASMLEWLAQRHGDERLAQAAQRIERSVGRTLLEPSGLTRDLGGKASTTDITKRVIEGLR